MKASWSEYKQWVEECIDTGKEFLFRGQSNAAWSLKTSFHRIAEVSGLTIQEYLDQAVPLANYYVSAFQDSYLDLSDESQLAIVLSTLQQHGFPTPLLDWTYSPYMAAYFAFRDINETEPQSDAVQVFRFDYLEWGAIHHGPSFRDSEEFISVLRPFAHRNPRALTQQSAYTFSTASDMMAYIQAREDIETQYLETITLPVKERPKAMLELQHMGITEASLFPGLDGLCRALKQKIFMQKEVGATPAERLQEMLEAIGLPKKGSGAE